MYRRRVRKRRYSTRYGSGYRRFLLSTSGYRSKANSFVSREAGRASGKARQKAKEHIRSGPVDWPGARRKSEKSYGKFQGHLRGYVGPGYKSTQMARVAQKGYKDAGYSARAWLRNWDWQRGRRLHYGVNDTKSVPLPNDYNLQRYAEWAYYPVLAGLHAKAYVESMPYTGDNAGVHEEL